LLILLTHSMNFHYIFGALTLPLTHSTHSLPPPPPPRSSPARRTSGSPGTGAFLLISVFHPCPRFSFWGEGRVFGLRIDGARRWRAVLSCSAVSSLYSAAFFSSAHTGSCVDWQLGSAWNADAGCAGPQLLTYQVALCS
jgi:hypothetical protein